MKPNHRSDPFGFPMIRVPELDLFVHSLPLTKMQFETFLCDVLDKDLDAGWYQQVLSLNPRASTRALSRLNFWQAFLTGIWAHQADRFARWCGPGYRLPTASEWNLIYRHVCEQPFTGLEWLGGGRFACPRFQRLHASLALICRAKSVSGGAGHMATSIWMVGGVLEWVGERFNLETAEACGSPDPSFYSVLKPPEHPVRPMPHGEIADYPFGARLVYDPSEEGKSE